jgi:hypothetical protein
MQSGLKRDERGRQTDDWKRDTYKSLEFGLSRRS